ncbi:M20/M25/M40 family metallo-hydrolase [Membranihabitans maritimus]|uniref:M20/M25/M40 family metallo-hydrolase n=1 Tax=Membranihabitans maritimus TaxID=2904244 RepID=UPI001F44278D|nr:M20/M25/M40 family metallo-hydrolase [Membranihabitans maritimus]
METIFISFFKKISTYTLIIFTSVSTLFSQEDITITELKDHISFLASEENMGRFPGTKANKQVIKYIKKEFKSSGLQKMKGGFFQDFKAKIRVKKGEESMPPVKTWNVVGMIQGNDPRLKNEYIVLGAHYDHLGMGGPSSKAPDTVAIHHGADDNASGTAALMEIAEKLSHNNTSLKRSIIFVAFGAEEQGLLGSKHFAQNPPIPAEQIKLMINMDMVGRLNNQNHIYMGGAGTFPGGVELMKNNAPDLGLTPIVHAGSVGGSDHVSFYRQQISVIGLHTGGHPQYHRPEDTVEKINFEGHQKVCEYIYSAILKIAGSDMPLTFIDQG